MTEKRDIPKKTSKGVVSVPDRLKLFDKNERFAVLATDDRGRPYASLVSYAVTPDLKKVIFATPRETQKYRNIIQARDVSLLIDNRGKAGSKGIMEAEAITIIGVAKPLRRGETWEKMAGIFLKKHPGLEEFIKATSTALIVVEAVRCIHVGHFQTVSVWDCGELEA